MAARHGTGPGPDLPTEPSHPDLEGEQRWLDRAHDHLAAMQRRAAALAEVGARAVRQENTVEARITQFHLQRREAALAEAAGPLCFGRIDTEDGDRWYIGRRHVEDDAARPVVVDWRAPVAAAFYRATAVDPCGLAFRRRFVIEDRRLTALLDERLDDPDADAVHGGLPDPLLAELERTRSGQMRDIVATIAAEQDEIIRAPLDELVIVQGGPGTGKTAVGLHRGAFLLFEHRHELTESKVLVIGPNRLFLRYIADVLPSLGETAVSQSTLEGLVESRYRVRAADDDEVARLKGRGVMATIVANAVRARFRVPAEGLELRAGVAVVRLGPDDLDQLQKTVLARRIPVNDGREVFRRLVLQEGWRRHGARPGVDPAGEPLFTSTVRADPAFRAAVDRMWPTANPAVVLRDLYGSARRLAVAADGLLDGDEQRLLRRKGVRKPAHEPWTADDIPLLDEAQHLIGGVPATYGHVIVDEAQDLSPMALRMLARRSRRGSMTVVGDQAQATSVCAAGSWDAVLEVLTRHLDEVAGAGWEGAVRRTELTVGYRVPAAILDVANTLLAEAAPDVTPARSIRPGGDPPLVVAVDGPSLGHAAVEEVVALRGRVASIAVVAVGPRLEQVAAALAAAGLPADRVGGGGLPGREAVALVTPTAVKGLEFDAVVVVEPAEIVELDAGLRHLYVAMTRAVQHLGLVHARPLPPALAAETSRPPM